MLSGTAIVENVEIPQKTKNAYAIEYIQRKLNQHMKEIAASSC